MQDSSARYPRRDCDSLSRMKSQGLTVFSAAEREGRQDLLRKMEKGSTRHL